MKRIICLLMALLMCTSQVYAAPSFVNSKNPVIVESEEITDTPPDYEYNFDEDSNGWFFKDNIFSIKDGALVSHDTYGSYTWLNYEEWENFDLEFDFTIEKQANTSAWFAPTIRNTDYVTYLSGQMNYMSAETGTKTGISLSAPLQLGETYTMRIEAEETKGTVYIKKKGSGFFEKAGSMPIASTKGRIGFIGMMELVKIDNVKIWDKAVRPFEFESLTGSLEVGKTEPAQFINNTGENVTFESSAPDVVSVDNEGNITALKVGTAVIKATNAEGYAVSTEITTEKFITALKACTNERNLYTGESINFKVDIWPTDSTNRVLEWTSSDENVLEIVGTTYNTRGLKAKSPGTAVLTIKTNDGLVEEKCTFTVTDRAPAEVGNAVFAMTGLSHEIAKYKFGTPNIAFHQANEFRHAYETYDPIETKLLEVINDVGFSHIMAPLKGYDFKNGVCADTGVAGSNHQYYLKEVVARYNDAAPFIVWQVQADNRAEGTEPLDVDYTIEMLKEVKALNPDKPLYLSLGPENYAMSYESLLPRVEDYIDFYSKVAKRVKAEVDPEAKISVSILPPRMYRAILSDPNNWFRGEGDMEYTQGTRASTWHTTIAAGDQSWFDAIDIHPYISNITDVNVTAEEFLHESSRTADYNTRTGLNEVARLFPDKDLWYTEWNDYQHQFYYGDAIDKGRAQVQRSVGSTVAMMQMLGEHMTDERAKVSSLHYPVDSQGFGLVSDDDKMPYYYAVKKACELFGANGRSTHAYPLALISGKITEDTISLNLDSEDLNTQEVYAYGFGDENNIKDVFFTNPTYKTMRVKLTDMTIRKDWEFKPKKADEPYPDFYVRLLDWKAHDPNSFDLPTVYENSEFSEYIELPPYSVVFASVNSTAQFAEIPENAKNMLVLKTTSNKAIMRDGYVRLIDTENADIKPVIVDNRALVPLRIAVESFDSYAVWNSKDQSIGIDGIRYRINMKIGSTELERDIIHYIEGDEETLTIDVAPQLIGGRTMVPLRALSEALENKVLWDEETGLIVISENEIQLTRDELKTLSDILG